MNDYQVDKIVAGMLTLAHSLVGDRTELFSSYLTKLMELDINREEIIKDSKIKKAILKKLAEIPNANSYDSARLAKELRSLVEQIQGDLNE